jgi:zinc protease
VPETRTLANGLQLVVLEDHAMPLAAVSLWVRAGSKHEIDSSAGYAHYLEHLVQRGNDTVGPYEYQRLSHRWGGSLSVRSNYDRTHITLTGVAAALPEMVAAAADMALHAGLKDHEIDLELGPLSQEIRTYYDEPSSVAFLETMRATFPRHPYRYPPLGKLQTLGRLKHEPLSSFYRNLYVPNNMVLAIAGDLDPVRTAALAEAAFGKARKSGTLPPRPAPPAGFAGHDDIEKRLDLKEPWTTLAFAAPGFRHPDRPAFEVLARALGVGTISPISGALAAEKLAPPAQVLYYRLEDAGMLYVGISPATRELSYVAAGAALREIIDVKKTGLDAAALKFLADGILRDERLRAETFAQQAEGLGEAALFGGIRYYWDLPAAYRRLTPADVNRVASTWLVGDNLRVVLILPKDTPPLAEEPKKKFHDTLESLGHAAKDAGVPGFQRALYPAAEASRVAPDAWGDPRDARGLKDPQRLVLENGLTVVTQEDHRRSLVGVSLHLKLGSGDDPAGKEGLANLTGHLLLGGQGSSGLGGIVKTGGRVTVVPAIQVSRDTTELRLLLDAADIEPGLRALAEAVKSPLPADLPFEPVRAGIRGALERSDRDPGFVSLELFHEKVYAGHPYGHATAGTPAGLQAVRREDLEALRVRALRPEGAVLAIAGDFPAAETARLARDLFGEWKGAAPADPDTKAAERQPPATGEARAGEFTRSVQSQQSSVIVGVPGVSIDHPDFQGVRFLGSALTILAFEDMVFKRRAAFSAAAMPEGLRDGGSLAIGVVASPVRRDEAVFDVQRLMRRLALEDLSAKDIEDTGRVQAGMQAVDAQGVLALASSLGYREACGLGAASLRPSLVPAPGLAPARVRELAARYLKPESWIVIKAGSPSP